MTVAEWIGTAILLATPYLVVGAAWTALNTDLLAGGGAARIVSILGSVLNWPALVFSAVCSA